MKKLAFTLGAAALLSSTFTQGALADTYQVKPGDTLWHIATEQETSVDQLKKLNGLTSDLILPNQLLAISPNRAATYIVKKGDTLSKIARENGISVNELMKWNQLSSDLIFPGDSLKLNIQPHTHGAELNTSSRTETALTVAQSNKQSSTKTLTVKATAYTAYCNGCTGITATGINLRENPNEKVIAVDPSVIPLGTKVHVEGYGYAVAGDTGSAIQGNKIDVFIPSKGQALQWGVQTVQVKVLE